MPQEASHGRRNPWCPDGLFLATAGPNIQEQGGLIREGLGWILSFPEAAFQPPGPMSHVRAHQDSPEDFLAPAPST